MFIFPIWPFQRDWENIPVIGIHSFLNQKSLIGFKEEVWRIKQILNEKIDTEDGNKLNLKKKVI